MAPQIPGHGEEMEDKSIEFGRMLANPKPGEEVVITGNKVHFLSENHVCILTNFKVCLDSIQTQRTSTNFGTT